MKKFLIILTCIWFAGCASVGTDFDMSVVDTFTVQVTTVEEVKQKLGAPTSSSVMHDGSVFYSWTYSQSRIGSARAQSVVIKFSKEGKFMQVLGRSQINTN
jgi:hypothetical protein